VLTWGKALAKLREQNGMTQRQLAAKAGVMRTHLCKIEKSQCKPTYATVVRLATALGIESNLLLTNSSMCAELLRQKLFLDPFVRKIYGLIHGLDGEKLRLIEAAVYDFSKNQMPITDWVKIADPSPVCSSTAGSPLGRGETSSPVRRDTRSLASR